MNIYRTYLHIVIALGLIGHAYRMTERWGVLVGSKKQDAAWEMSETLIEHHGYCYCPGCGWAVKNEDDHTRVCGSWCHNESVINQTGFSLDQIEEMQERHRAREEEYQPAPRLLFPSVFDCE